MKKYSSLIRVIGFCCFGLLAFYLIANPIFDPYNIHWLGGSLDPAQQYLGWALFRAGPWSFPIGLNPFNGLEFSNSIVFSDSIPIFAFIFKLISPFLPLQFQYFGFWTLICFVLQAWFAWKLVGLITLNKWIQFLSSGFFVFSPPMLVRVGLHTALVSHFLILAALYLNFRSNQKNRILCWSFLVVTASLVHFYLLAMILILWIASMIDGYWLSKPASIISFLTEFALVALLLLLGLWQAGYLSVASSSGVASGYGVFQLNLLSLVDSRGWSYILPSIPMPIDFGNGFNYLGLGSLLLVFFALLSFLRRKRIDFFILRGHYFLYFTFFLLTLFSISNTIAVGTWKYYFEIPDTLFHLASLLRASGRMFWPVFYFIIFVAIVVIIKVYSRKLTIGILGICLLVQIIDTSAGWLIIRNDLIQKSSSSNRNILSDRLWDSLGSHYRDLVRFPAKNLGDHWEVFANYAAQHAMGTNSVFLARLDQAKLEMSNQALVATLQNGPLDPQRLYILSDWKHHPVELAFNPKIDLLAELNGFLLLAPGWKTCSNCPLPNPQQERTRFAPITQMGVPIAFSQNASGRADFLLNGWAPYGEAWGTWTDGPKANFLLPLPVDAQKWPPQALILNLRAFVNAQHPSQELDIFINDQKVKRVVLTQFDGNEVSLPLRSFLNSKLLKIEFVMHNPARPKDLGFSLDDRLLGVGVITAQFN